MLRSLYSARECLCRRNLVLVPLSVFFCAIRGFDFLTWATLRRSSSRGCAETALRARALLFPLSGERDMRPFRVFHPVSHVLRVHDRPAQPPGGDVGFLSRFSSLVKNHQSDRMLTTAVAAASMSMSRMHLNRRLRASTGQSTHEFIQALRLNRARELLVQHSTPIAAIAQEVGFRSISHFTKAFRLRFGITPARYRRGQPVLQAMESRRSPYRPIDSTKGGDVT